MLAHHVFFNQRLFHPFTGICSIRKSQGRHSHILLMGGGCPTDFFGFEILATRDFFGSMKDAEIFLDRGKKGFFGGIVLFISSN